jgi:hypothetical protein
MMIFVKIYIQLNIKEYFQQIFKIFIKIKYNILSFMKNEYSYGYQIKHVKYSMK